MTAPVQVTLEREHVRAVGQARYMLAVLEQLGLDVRQTIDDLDEIVSAAWAARERVAACGGQHSVRVDRMGGGQ